MIIALPTLWPLQICDTVAFKCSMGCSSRRSIISLPPWERGPYTTSVFFKRKSVHFKNDVKDVDHSQMSRPICNRVRRSQ